MVENPLSPSAATEARIRERAYFLWLHDGCPEGRQNEYWERARELQAIADSDGAGQMPNPMTLHPDPTTDQVIEEAAIQDNLGEFPHANLRDQGDREETPHPGRRARQSR